MSRSASSALLPCALLLSSCIATVGHSSGVTVPKDSAQTCSTTCTDIGLTLSSVVVMANTVGCVCGAKGASATADGAAASAGMATVMLQEQAQQQATQPPPPAGR